MYFNACEIGFWCILGDRKSISALISSFTYQVAVSCMHMHLLTNFTALFTKNSKKTLQTCATRHYFPNLEDDKKELLIIFFLEADLCGSTKPFFVAAFSVKLCFGYQFGIGESSFDTLKDQHAWPSRTTPLQSGCSMCYDS